MKEKFKAVFGKEWVLGCLLALGTLLVYSPVLRQPFINYDDYEYVVENARVNHGLSWPGVIWAFQSTSASNWHPLTWLSHMLDCQIYGLRAGGHHLTNLLFHMANAVLLFVLLRRLTGAKWRSAMVAALFAWHPLHVESVAWVSERKDVLSAFFWLLTMLAYARYVKESKVQSPKSKVFFYVLTLGCFALGLMAKPMVVTLPFALLLLDFWPLRRIADFGLQLAHPPGQPAVAPKPVPLGWLVLEKVPFFALSAASSFVTYVVQRGGGAVMSSSELPFDLRASNALVSYCRYLGKAFWPHPLAAPYPHPGEWPVEIVSGAMLFLLVVSAVVVWQGRRRPYLLVGWFWYVGVLVPAIGFVQVGGQAMADRYTYLPLIGVTIMVVWGLGDLIAGWPARRWALGTSAAAALAACLAVTRAQVPYWKDAETLFRHALAVTTDNALAHTCLGTALVGMGRNVDAVAEFEAALKLRPAMGDAHFHLAGALMKLGRPEEAISHCEATLKIWPSYPEARFDYGNALALSGRFEEAIAQYQTALQLKPGLTRASYNLADVYIKQGKLEAAKAEYEQLLVADPDYSAAHNNLAMVLIRLGKKQEAAAHLEQALKTDPKSAEAQGNMGSVLEEQGRREEAIPYYREALRLRPDYPEVRMKLGLALAQRKDLAGAVEQLREAARLKPNDADLQYSLGFVLAEMGKKEESASQYADALRLEPGLAERYRKNGETALQQGNLAAACSSLVASLKLKPEDAEAQKQLGLAFAQSGNLAAAEPHFTEAARLRPADAEARYNLAMTQEGLGRQEAAIQSYREAVRLNADATNALNNLAWILATCPKPEMRDGKEAVRLAQHACELTGNKEAMFLGTLAASLAEAGRFAEAVATAQKAKDLALAAGQPDLAKRNQQLQELYQSNQPYHEPEK